MTLVALSRTALESVPGSVITGARFQGLEQFPARSTTGGISYCIAGPTPYSLDFATDFDVICLLLGDIAGRTRFDDDRECEMVFRGETAAFHPGGGNVRVDAQRVRHGFIAFGFSPEFQEVADDHRLSALRREGTRNNLRRVEIRHLARYVRERMRGSDRLDRLELQSLATLTYLHTLRSLESRPSERPGGGLSDAAFRLICDHIDAELANEISCEGIAAAAGLPLRVVFDGMKARTGMSPYKYVVERRLARACHLLRSTDDPIADIAFACGFSSQQHLTSAMSTRLGRTPLRVRRDG
ncbi:helix-turn-helix domain-containing protein [Marinibaculum pumilum]|uniref:Helix-turn-helix domain-containing protein n=1 Tax=Marinibaculum pumilum TaxID=1766165 RepID=A0ABV7L7R2_9PROT